jgi:UDP-N-acetylglucosamine--N-acetylmuramyl-(pentapeptide) pyrophosphoryl-undecaprenol N-acetylglucosamine transferase
VLIPLATSAVTEQAHKARHLQEQGAAAALIEGVSGSFLCEEVAQLLAHPQLRAAMADRARALGRPDAAERLAGLLRSAACVKAGRRVCGVIGGAVVGVVPKPRVWHGR